MVIENTHRLYANGKMPIVKSAKEAAGEVFIPVPVSYTHLDVYKRQEPDGAV